MGRTPNPLLHRALDATKAASSGSRGGSSFTDASEEETGKGEKSKTFLGRLKVLTFNLLAPCYFRSDGVYESASMRKTLRRHRCIIEVLRDQRCDVCCLQEFWFNDYLRDLYQEELGHLYSINSLQRTRSEDGVAILMLKEKFHIVNKHDIYFREHSNFGHDRVALVVLAQLANVMTKEVAAASVGDGGGERPSASAKGTCSPPIAIVTSHLTYPHNKLDEISRLEQSKVMVGKTREFIENSCPSGTPVIIAGDFNGISEDQVCGQMRSSGYLDAFSQATGIHHSSERITHCDHRKEQKGVDYIWVSSAEGNAAPIGAGERAKAEGSQGAAADPGKGGRRDAGAQSRRNMLPFDETAGIELCAMEAYLLPRDIPCNTKMHRPKFGDFRAPGKAAREGGEESLKTAKLTLNSYDSYDNVEDPSFAGDLDWRSWCNMSDHRPMVVHFDMYGS